MKMDVFLHTLGAEVVDATASPTAGSDFIKLGIFYKLHQAHAIQVITAQIANLKQNLHPTYADDLLKALLCSCLKAMQAEQQERERETLEIKLKGVLALQLQVGQRIRLLRPVGRDPYFLAQAGLTGALDKVIQDNSGVTYISAHMDQPLSLDPAHQADIEAEWGNRIEWDQPDFIAEFLEDCALLAPGEEQQECAESAGKYTILAFTEQGIRGMKAHAQGRLEQHREDIERLNELRTWLLEDGPDDQGPTALVGDLNHHLEAMFDSKVSELEEHIAVCEATIASFELGGY